MRSFPLELIEPQIVDLEIEAQVIEVVPEPYTGEYEITPTSESQTIEIKDKMAVENITVAPIPSNYGLITWDGGILTIS